jgi:hypothetical protein
VDAAEDGDEIVVTNGLYATGGRGVSGTMTNRVAITKAVTVRSVNGLLLTTIAGRAVSGGPNGNGAIRCVYVGSNAVLSGFTLTNGHTRLAGDLYKEQSGGGVWCELSGIVTNCSLSGNSAGTNGGAAYSGVLNNCTLSGNSVNGPYGSGGGACNATLNNCILSNNSAPGVFSCGGGAYYGTLNNCTLIGNTVYGTREVGTGGGGAYGSTLNNCALIGNTSTDEGGGAMYATLNNCTLTGNTADDGGAAGHCTLNDCTLSNNWVWYWGGGAYYGTMNNCIVSGNSAGVVGGGTFSNSLNNCTLSGNSASYGGGAEGGTLTNCIIYYNSAPNGPNYDGASIKYCCTTPLPPGPGNITNAPLFVDTNGWINLRLQADSPCINAGYNPSAPAAPDLDGNQRIRGGTVDIGAYEFQTPTSVLPYFWLQKYGLSTDGSADFADTDGDGMNNWGEWLTKTDPTNVLSVLKMLPLASTNNPSGKIVSWKSVTNATYYLQRASSLVAQSSFISIRSNIVGLAGTTSFTDTNATGPGPFFYRVGVQ